MANPLQQAAQLAGNTARFGWYFGLNWLVDREAAKLGAKPVFKPTRPVPTRQELMADLAAVFLADASAVRAGLYPAMPHGVV